MDAGGDSSHLWGILSNAEWDLIKWVLKNLGGVGLFTGLIESLRELRGGTRDWWFLGAVFAVSLSILYAVTDRPQPFHLWVELIPILCVVIVVGSAIWMKSVGAASALSLRDNEKREEIELFFKCYIQPLNDAVRKVAARLREHLRQSQTERDRDLSVFSIDYGKGIHGRASGELKSEFAIPENGSLDPLHRKMREFCNAYHGLVDYLNHLIQFSSYPLKEDPDYEKWRDQHKLFHLELTKLLAKEKDLSTLKRGLRIEWPDVLR